MFPHRHRAELTDPLTLPSLPKSDWDGRIAFLDRDGVLNRGSSEYVNSVEELVVLPRAAESVGRLRRVGHRICIVTNQSPIGRGWWDHERLATIHDALAKRLLEDDEDAHLDLILYSPYAPWDGSHARKGAPGMLEVGRQLLDAAESGTNLSVEDIAYEETWDSRSTADRDSRSVMVGDRLPDVEAGLAFGIRTIRCDPRFGLASVIDEIVPNPD